MDIKFVETFDLGTNTVGWYRKDPYGHIYLGLAEGELPSKYQGAYTTIDYARLAIDQYKNEREMALEKVSRKKNG